MYLSRNIIFYHQKLTQSAAASYKYAIFMRSIFYDSNKHQRFMHTPRETLLKMFCKMIIVNMVSVTLCTIHVYIL